MANNYGVLLIFLFPVLGGIIGFFLGKKNKGTRNDWIDIVVIVQLAMLAYLAYMTIGKGTTFELSLGNFLGLGLSLTMDVVSVLLSILVTVVVAIVTQFMKESMKKEESSNRFYLLFMCTFGMILGACMTDNLFNFFMFITLALLFAWPLIMHRRDKLALANANIYIGFVTAGMVLILTGIVILFGYLGSVNYSGMYSSVMSRGGSGALLIAGLLTSLGFAMTAGVFPVQFQVTRGCSYGLIEISTLLSSLVSKLGIYGILVIAVDLFVENKFYGRVLLVAALMTAVWGILVTLTSTDIRKILMGLDIATNGFVLLAVSLLVLGGSSNQYSVRSVVYLLFASAISIAVLYMVSLELVRRNQNYEIKGLVASGKGNPLLGAATLLAGISLAGVPGTLGYLGYGTLFKSISTGIGWKWLVVVYIILWGFLMTAVLRIFMKFFISKPDEPLRILTSEEEELVGDNSLEAKGKDDQNAYRFGEILLLLAGVVQVVMGVIPEWSANYQPIITKFITFCNLNETVHLEVNVYSKSVLLAGGIAVILCALFYTNLVHGVLLRVIRNRKNKKLKAEAEQNKENM
ncbi:MAG: complex I subunit 5 family protein [Lachnospiraceae bacterium]|nr:complex I subunit 5 family protein [Lachnospiraceae bacterium]HCJ07882.1 hypothetical protein [Lachnospiraceae bacterium]